MLWVTSVVTNSARSASDPATADLKRVAMQVARQRAFVGTHTDFGISSFCW